MLKTSNWFVLLFLILAFSCNQQQETQETVNRPNVILIITDDQGYGDLGRHGNSIIQTPFMDQLYQESVRFTDFHVSPTCSPTRAALMTGRYNNRTGVWHTIGGWSLLRENEKTLGDMFSEAGYKTGAFGKWHLGDNYPFRPYDRGFQETVMHGGGGVQQTPDYWGNDYFDDTYFKNGQAQAFKGYCTDVFFEEAIGFIEKYKEKPFFCYIATNAPHSPYNVPLSYYEKYAEIDETKLLDFQKRFLGMVTNIDDNLGKLREKLNELQIADNTILIFMADNGTAAGSFSKDGNSYGFNAGMRGTKGSQYDGGHRVPFFVYWKDGKLYGGKDIDRLSAHIDVMPTLAELCGLNLPKDHLEIDGKSLVPLMKGDTAQWNERMLITDSQRIQVPEKWRKSAVMSDRWRLVDGQELYDIKADPGQVQDLANQHPDQVSIMKKAYEDWWTSTSTNFDIEPAIMIGTEMENPVVLTAHDWHGDNGIHPWNQFHIRKGELKQHGYWTVEIVEEGDYEIALSRYPVESGLAINTTTPGVTMEDLPGIDRDIPAGENLNFVSGWVKVGTGGEAANVVEEGAQAVNMKVRLAAGQTSVTAGFLDNKDKDYGAYYVTIRKL